MENASKALLIAGAVLIVILLIAVGMMIYNGARGTVDESVAQMSSQQIEAFNAQFTQAGTTRVTGTQVNSLVQKIEANNIQNPNGSGKFITFVQPQNVQPSTLWQIDYFKNADTGLIEEIQFTLGTNPGSITQR